MMAGWNGSCTQAGEARVEGAVEGPSAARAWAGAGKVGRRRPRRGLGGAAACPPGGPAIADQELRAAGTGPLPTRARRDTGPKQARVGLERRPWLAGGDPARALNQHLRRFLLMD